jgi:N utilization substance protein A
MFAPLPAETEVGVNPKLSDLSGVPPATVAVLEEAGFRTLDDIMDLEREDFLRLPGIAPEEADRLMAIINELTTDDPAEATESVEAPEAEPTEGTPESNGAEPDAGGTEGK